MSNLLETLRDALRRGINDKWGDRSNVEQYAKILSLLSTPDALAWALLEEMAGDVEVERRWVGETQQGILEDWFEIGDPKRLILCLARALQEQRRRESEHV